MASGMDRTRFEGYKVMGTLGSGTFGVVYKVQPDSQQQGSPLKDNTEQVFALKRVQLGFGNTERERELVRREEQILKAMKHRHVIRYVHSFFEDNVMCIVMEYCDGGTLHQYIRALKQKMHEDTFICFLEQIAQGLKYLHGKKILHRDIKTKNILMTSGNILKIGDFGISKFVDNTKPAPHSILMGTPRYMSPQVAKRDDYDQKTDIWGLGCTAYEMAVFTYAFPSADLKSVLDNVKGGKIPDLTEIRYCSEIKGLISQMLQYNPEDRPSARKVLKILLDHECSQELAEPRQLKEKDGNGRISPQPTEFKTDSGLGSDTATLLNKTDPQTRAKKHLEVACCDITTTIVDKIRKRNAVDIIKKIKDGSSLQEAEKILKESITRRKFNAIWPLVDILYNLERSVSVLNEIDDATLVSVTSSWDTDT